MISAYILNVGQASFNMIFDSSSKHLLIVDCGYQLRSLRLYKTVTPKDMIIQTFRIILSSLEAQNISIVLSHTDLDHISGFKEVLRAIAQQDANIKINLYISRAIPNNNKVVLWPRNESAIKLAFYYYYNPYMRFEKQNFLEEIRKKKDMEIEEEKNTKEKKDEMGNIIINLVNDMDYPGDSTIIQLGTEYKCVIYNPIAALRWHLKYQNNIDHQNITDEMILKHAEEIGFFKKEYSSQERQFAEDLGFWDTQSVNPFSLICKVIYNKPVLLNEDEPVSLLLPGDATSQSFRIINSVLVNIKQEKDIEPYDLVSHIYIGSHHGSAIDPEVIKDIIKPQMIIYSAPLISEFGHIKTTTINDNIEYFNSQESSDKIKFLDLKYDHPLYLGESEDKEIKILDTKEYFIKKTKKIFSFNRKEIKQKILNKQNIKEESKAFINQHLSYYKKGTLESKDDFHKLKHQKEKGKVQSIYIKSSEREKLYKEIEWKEDNYSIKDTITTNIEDILKNNTAKKHDRIIKFITNLPIFSTGSHGTIKLFFHNTTVYIHTLEKLVPGKQPYHPYELEDLTLSDSVEELTDYEKMENPEV